MGVNGVGPVPAKVMLIGEFPMERDVELNRPFQSAGGAELYKMLHEAGINMNECFQTNICRERPPGNQISAFIALKKKDITPAHFQLKGKWVTKEILEGYTLLQSEIEAVRPNLIITFGNLALWALTGAWGVLKWRGSQLKTENGIKLIPTLHPANILREWSQRALCVNDLRRAKRFIDISGTYPNIPSWNFTIRPSYEKVHFIINNLLHILEKEKLWIEFDLETGIQSKHIRCAGISWSSSDALCIPLTDAKGNYWELEEEAGVIYLLYKLLTHPNALIRGQNLLFDCQYTYRYWHFIPNVAQDTMISSHSAFCALPKGLDFLASMHCDFYKQWKTISWT